MPKYKNTTTENIILESTKVVKPGEEVETYIYHYVNGLQKISESPQWVPAVSSEIYSGNKNQESSEINVPTGLKQYVITVHCVSGAVSIIFNGLTSKPYKLATGMGRTWTFIFRYVDKLKLKYEADGTVCVVTIEDLTQ